METRFTGWEPTQVGGTLYAVTADGKRFLMNRATDGVRPIHVVLNWPAVLGR
jgi:hypothetical protein